MDGNGETTPLYNNDLAHHPIETTIKKLVVLEFQAYRNTIQKHLF